MAKQYWQDRQADAMNRLSNKSIKEIEKQLKKYYLTAMNHAISDFEAVYDKLLATMEDGKAPTPADLYLLDKYWKAQGQLKQELQKLGDKQAELLSKKFEENFFEVYYSLAKDSSPSFGTVDIAKAQQIINQIWAADGKSWSSRIWKNTAKLAETLNEELVDAVINGKKTTDLKKKLQERFNVSYTQADSLVRTEIANIQVKAAEQSYKDAGIEYEQVWASEDERRCDVCGKLHEKKFPVGTAPIPAHPRCRCCVVPVVEIDEEIMEEKKMDKNVCSRCGAKLTDTGDKIMKLCKKCQTEDMKETIKAWEVDKKIYKPFVDEVEKYYPGALDAERERVTFRWKEQLDATKRSLKNIRMDDSTRQILQERADYLEAKIAKNLINVDYGVMHDYVFCIDCHKPIPVDGKKTNAQKRCPECQLIHRRFQKAEAERKRRAKKKST